MNICEAQLWGGTKRMKEKYTRQLEYFKKKLKEEEVYIEYYTQELEFDNKIDNYYKNQRQVQTV